MRPGNDLEAWCNHERLHLRNCVTQNRHHRMWHIIDITSLRSINYQWPVAAAVGSRPAYAYSTAAAVMHAIRVPDRTTVHAAARVPRIGRLPWPRSAAKQ